MVDAEWTILYNKLEKIVSSGAKVVLSKLPIGDVATQYFADRCDQATSSPPLHLIDSCVRVFVCVFLCV